MCQPYECIFLLSDVQLFTVVAPHCDRFMPGAKRNVTGLDRFCIEKCGNYHEGSRPETERGRKFDEMIQDRKETDCNKGTKTDGFYYKHVTLKNEML